MNRKVTVTAITCVLAGIGVYLAITRIREKKFRKRNAGLQSAKPTSGYAYEYTL